MGLDMYAIKSKKFTQSKEDPLHHVFEDDQSKTDTVLFRTWRKENALHEFMNRLYVSKGGTYEFNCVAINLGSEDLDNLEKAIKAKSLTPTAGFFFGSLEPVSDEQYQDYQEFVDESRQAIAEGYSVFYDSWW